MIVMVDEFRLAVDLQLSCNKRAKLLDRAETEFNPEKIEYLYTKYYLPILPGFLGGSRY
jgi:hypothetical protein